MAVYNIKSGKNGDISSPNFPLIIPLIPYEAPYLPLYAPLFPSKIGIKLDFTAFFAALI